MKAQVVYEHKEDFDLNYGPYGSTKVGVLIEDRVIWLSCCSDSSGTEHYRKWEVIAKKIASSLNVE